MGAAVTRAIAILAVMLVTGCGGRAAGPPPSAEAPDREAPYVVMVSFDGFRADYVGRADTPALDAMAREGARAQALIPAFPTKTFPNHYTIATGMYPADHGIVANAFYDPERDATYSVRDAETVGDGTWYRGEPIWVTAETQGLGAATMYWVGSEADIGGVRPTIWMPYDADLPNGERVDTVLSWLARPPDERPHLVTLYIGDVDSAGHTYGPDAPEVEAAIERVDAALGRLLRGIDELPIRDEVYVVVVSDHGMAARGPDTAVAIDDLIDVDGIRVASTGAVANLHVEGDTGRAAEVRDALNEELAHGRAYLRREVPSRLHYRRDPRIGDVVVIMDESWEILPGEALPRAAGGSHGWDPRRPSMHGIFAVTGPDIRAGALVPAFESIHIYPFVAQILGLEPNPEARGDPDWLRAQVAPTLAPGP